MTAQLAAALATALALAACSRGRSESSSASPTAHSATPLPSAASAKPPTPGPVHYDGYGSCYRLIGDKQVSVPVCPKSVLPFPPRDRLVYELQGNCHSVPDGKLVRCPPGGATVLLPTDFRSGNVSCGSPCWGVESGCP